MSNCGGCDEITLPLGQDGVDGKNAFTRTTSAFIQPTANQNVTINVSNIGQFSNLWASVGQVIFISNLSGNGGYYSVVSTTGTESIEIKNLNYPGNTPENLPINFPANVSPAGLRGAAGGDGERGDDGDDGLQGAAGLNGVSIIRTAQGTNTLLGAFTNIATIATFAANDLCRQDGDKSVLESTVYVASSDATAGNIRVLLNGVSITPALISVGVTSEPTFKNSLIVGGSNMGGSGFIKVDIYRKSSTLAGVTVCTSDISGTTLTYNSGDYTTDFASAITLQIQGRVGKPAFDRLIGCNTLTITSFKQQQ
jgi:hypothetical protein